MLKAPPNHLMWLKMQASHSISLEFTFISYHSLPLISSRIPRVIITIFMFFDTKLVYSSVNMLIYYIWGIAVPFFPKSQGSYHWLRSQALYYIYMKEPSLIDTREKDANFSLHSSLDISVHDQHSQSNSFFAIFFISANFLFRKILFTDG